MKRALKVLFIIFLHLCAVIPGLQESDAQAATLRALLIGIDEYKAPDVPDLRGCENDVELMRATLLDKFNVLPENVKMLKNEQATRQGIILAIQRHLIEKTQTGDIVILHYSGHGSQMVDSSKDEIDGYDESLVAHDSRTEGVFDISDDEISGLLNQLTEKTKNVTFIFDSCHSGSAARGGNTVRMIKADTRPLPPAESFAANTRGTGEGETDFRQNGSDYVLISGCRATELSNEAMFAGRRHGVMTWFLVQALRAANNHSTYKSVMDEVRAEATARYASQHPQLEGPGINLAVFGTDRITTRPSVLVESVDGRRVKIGGGKIYGLSVDSVLDVYPLGTTDFTSMQPIGTIKITKVYDYTADAVIESGSVVPQTRALLEKMSFGDISIPVYLGEDNTKTIEPVRRILADFTAILLVDSPKDARFIIGIEGSEIYIRNGDLEAAANPVSLSAPDYVEKVVDQIKSLAHWAGVMELKNSRGGIRLGFDVQRTDDPVNTPIPKEVASGTKLTYRVHNLDRIPLYIYVLDVSSDGSIALLYPQVTGAQEALPDGQVLEKTIETFLPKGHKTVTDLFKVIAATKPIDPFVFPQGAITRAAASRVERQPEDQLSHFFFNALRGKRGSRPVAVKSWVTAQRSVVIR